MDKETLSNYGWIVICVLVLVVMIALATPFGSFVSQAVQNTTKGLFDVNKTTLDAAGVPGLTVQDQEFDVPDMNHQEVIIDTMILDGVEYQYEAGMTWEEWCESDYNTGGYYIRRVGLPSVDVDGELYDVRYNTAIVSNIACGHSFVDKDHEIIKGEKYIICDAGETERDMSGTGIRVGTEYYDARDLNFKFVYNAERKVNTVPGLGA